VAVAALQLLAEGLAARILVIDLDVHQGDGTAQILADEPRVFTLSIHAEKNYPHPKQRSDLDVGLADAMEDEAYLAVLAETLEAAEAFRPDLVFYNAGVDPHRDDRLGRLALSDDGLRRRDRMVLRRLHARGTPVCGVIGGGYSRDVDALALRHAILFEEASALL
jgi:acetoin utilization deacetylase AcuC-like enzyme